MAKPIPKIYDEIITKYQLGEGTISQLARKYGVKRGTLASFISKNNITLSNNLAVGLNSLKGGLMAMNAELKEISSGELSNENVKRRISALMQGFEQLEAYGDFGHYMVALMKKGLKKGNEMLDKAQTPEEFAQAMRGIKIGADTLGMTPKMPLVAIQNNINQNLKNNNNKNNVEVKVEFIKPENKDGDIIEVETE